MDSYTIHKPEQEWKGLTLDEIRYARALTETRILISREIVGARAKATFNGSGGRSLVGRMFGSLSLMDYGVFALRIGSKFFKLFRRKK